MRSSRENSLRTLRFGVVLWIPDVSVGGLCLWQKCSHVDVELLHCPAVGFNGSGLMLWCFG